MPPPSGRMTKNQLQTTRYFPGKAVVDDVGDEDEESDEEEEEEEEEEEDEQQAAPKVAPLKATSFPTGKKLAVDLSKAGQQKSIEVTARRPEDDLEGFVTASESSGDGEEGSSDEEEDSSEEDSSDDEPKKPMLRPTFISKAKRASQAASTPAQSEAQRAEQEGRKRKEKADELLQAQLEREAAAKAAGRKAWDDDADIDPEHEVDDTDGLHPEAEKAAWKLRELKRVRRERLAIEEKEKELAEIERRRNMTAEEREAEDKAYMEAQKEEREGKGKMAFMQKYHHKGAFFAGDEEQDEEVKAIVNRDLAGARYEDETGDKSVLPEYMRIRDMTKLGKKGRTKYKDLKNEDTGRWGMDVGRKRRDEDGLDERFRSDDPRDGGREQTGANAQPVGERRRREDDGPGHEDQKRARHD